MAEILGYTPTTVDKLHNFGLRSARGSGKTIILDQTQMPWLLEPRTKAHLVTVELESGGTVFVGSAITGNLQQGMPGSAHQISTDKAFYQTVARAHLMMPGVMLLSKESFPPIYHQQIVESRSGSGRHSSTTKDNEPIIYVMKLEPAADRSYATYLRVAIGEKRNHAAIVRKLRY